MNQFVIGSDFGCGLSWNRMTADGRPFAFNEAVTEKREGEVSPARSSAY